MNPSRENRLRDPADLKATIGSLPVLVPRAHTVYDQEIRTKSEYYEPIFEILAQPGRLPHGALLEISTRTKIPKDTLKTWRSKVKEDANWRPHHGSPGCPRVFTKEQESALRDKIVDVIQRQEYISREQSKEFAREMWRNEVEKRLNAESDETEAQTGYNRPQDDVKVLWARAKRDPRFSWVWQKSFEERWGLSYRVPHVRRRSRPDDDYVARFVEEIELAKMQFPQSCIFNADETCWRIVNGKIKTLALKGSDEVNIQSNFDAKKSVTVMACCSADGKKLPLMVITSGTTPACEEKFRQNERLRHYINRKLFIDHTERGWSTHEFAQRYLKFISRQVHERQILLTWDLHSSHRKDCVREYAKEHSIHLSFIPAGQTSYWQPLDRRLFGILKKKATAELERTTYDSSLTEISIMDAVLVLVRVWESLPEETIRASWSHLMD